jgi:hypothetical protein
MLRFAGAGLLKKEREAVLMLPMKSMGTILHLEMQSNPKFTIFVDPERRLQKTGQDNLVQTLNYCRQQKTGKYK